ncbi:MAG TPA: matrixin family metalloprotease [Actinomycetota bacterium]|nr:matrixin family metalloprotease [Actinomycetota bacterium]
MRQAKGVLRSGSSFVRRAGRTAGLSLVVLSAALGTVGRGAPSEPGPAPERTTESVTEAVEERTLLGLRPGTPVEVRGVELAVPEPGTSLWAEVLLHDGGTRVVGAETRPDGGVVLRSGDGVPVMELMASGSTNPCADGAYATYGKRWTRRFEWYFQARSTPSYLSASAAEATFRTAVRSVVHARNDCGLAVDVGARSLYRGRTGAAPNISSSGTCTQRDGRNVVGFGKLPSGYLGLSCWWASGSMVEADMKLNSAAFRWVTSVPAGCRDRWHVGAVAAHEFGHIFGLAHVSEKAHPNLTMSQRIRPCQASELTLGLGDVRALRSLY